MTRVKQYAGILFLAAVICLLALSFGADSAFAGTTYEDGDNGKIATADEWIIEEGDGNHYIGQGVSKRQGLKDAVTEYEYAKFTLPTAGKLTFTFKGDVVKGSVDSSKVIFYNAAGLPDYKEDMWIMYCYYNDALDQVYGEETIYLSAGTYYVAATFYEITMDYDIQMNYEPLEDDLEEPGVTNDTLGTATKISPNKAYDGVLALSSSVAKWVAQDDVDFVKVTVPSTGTYYLNFRWDNTGSSQKFKVTEYNSKGEKIKTIYSLKEDTMGEDEYHTHVMDTVKLKKGTHYFKIERDRKKNVGAKVFQTAETLGQTAYSFDISKKLSAPSNIKATQSGKTSIKLTWKKRSGADAYHIYRYDSKAKKSYYVGSTTKTSYTVKDLKVGKTYSYKIQPSRQINNDTQWGFTSKAVSKKVVKK